MLACSFNGWTQQPMTVDKDGRWEREEAIELPDGFPPADAPSCTYRRVPPVLCQYKFVVDGAWYYDMRAPTAKDGFGNVNNVLDLTAVAYEEALWREQSRDSPTRWLVCRRVATTTNTQQQQQQPSTRWVPLSSAACRALDAACMEGATLAYLGTGTGCYVSFKRRYVGGRRQVTAWLVQQPCSAAASAAEVSFGQGEEVRCVGAMPFYAPPPLHACRYGLDTYGDGDEDEDDIVNSRMGSESPIPRRATLDAQRHHHHTSSGDSGAQGSSQSVFYRAPSTSPCLPRTPTVCCSPSSSLNSSEGGSGVGLLDLPDDVLVRVMKGLLNRCRCSCHRGQVAAEPCVTALCTMELVCKRFSALCSNGSRRESIPEQAARELCLALRPDDTTLRRRCWKEQLLDTDPKVAERTELERAALYRMAFGRAPCDRSPRYNNIGVKRAYALAEIHRRWGTVDPALQRRAEQQDIAQ